MDSPRPASRFGPALWLLIFVFIVLGLYAAGSCFLHPLAAQTLIPADPAWRTCTAPSGQVCLAVDVTTELAADPVTGLPKTVQYLKGVKVTASWPSGWFHGSSQSQTQVTNAVGRAVFQVPLNKDITLKSDTTGMLVSVTNPVTGAPEGHAYIDRTQSVDQKNVYGPMRTMIILSLNPAVALK